MKLSTLAQFSKNATRFKEVVSVLMKYGLANWIKTNDPDFIKGLLKSSGGQKLSDLNPATRLRMALTELGPTFIKLGQILSTRADLIGPEMADELTKLQADVPADSPDVVQRIVEQELGRPRTQNRQCPE
jgi:ubiquinone biosynthesis protein